MSQTMAEQTEKTDENRRREHLLKVLQEKGRACVTVWGLYFATGEGCTAMLAYWTVRSEEEIKARIEKHFGDWFGRSCQYAEGFMTQETLQANPDNPAWIGWKTDFGQTDKNMLSENFRKRISSNLFSIEHTQMSHWNGS